MSKPSYHQSSINMFLKCGLQYFFRYIEGIKTPPKAALTVGSSVDCAVYTNLDQKIATGKDLKESDVLDAYSTKFDALAPETEWEEPKDKQKDMGIELVKVHHKELAPRITPVATQVKFTIPINEHYDIGGVIDHIEEGGIIVDTKTSKNPYQPDAAKFSLQPVMYDLAYETLNQEPANGFRYDVLVKPTARNPARAAPTPTTKVTQIERDFMLNTISKAHEAIQAGLFMPAPEGSWWCGEKWCGYWNICKGKK